LEGSAVCVKCSTEFLLRESIDKNIFHSVNLERADCPNCDTRLVFSDEEKKQGVFICAVCNKEGYIWEVRNRSCQDNVDGLNVRIEQALQNNDYEKFSALTNLNLPKLKQKLAQVVKSAKNSKKVGKVLGWTAAILTGGIGLEDLLIIPAVTYAAQRILGTSLEKALERFSQLVYRKVLILSQDEFRLTKSEFAFLIEEAYLFLILREIRDIEAFLYQIESYANREPSVEENISYIEKVEGLFERSSNKTSESMGYFWISIAKIIINLYPGSTFYSTVENYYLGSETKEQKKEEVDNDILKYERILGVKWSGSNFEEIKTAYRKLVNIHHPDKNGGDNTKFLEIQEAYIFFKQLSS
jgi:hypothetical protein